MLARAETLESDILQSSGLFPATCSSKHLIYDYVIPVVTSYGLDFCCFG